MNTPGLFTANARTIQLDKIGDSIEVATFSDVHRNSFLHCDDAFKEFLRWGRTADNPYFFGVGDYLDAFSTSERAILANPGLHETTRFTLEELQINLIEKLVKELSFMAPEGESSRLLGLIEGNHYGVLENGKSTTCLLAQKLRAPYMGVCGLFRLTLEAQGVRAAADWFLHHGKGAARLIGGSLNRVQQMSEGFEADIYVMGHDHKKNAGTTSRLYFARRGEECLVKERKKVFVRAGSFVRGYVPGKKSYVADGAMNPTDLGFVTLRLTLRRDKKKGGRGAWIDIKPTVC